MLSKKFTAVAGAAAAPEDASFQNVTMLLSGDGTNGAQNNTFTDSSTNNFTITRNGNTTQGTYSPYGTLWSNYFDGSGNRLSLDKAASSFGTGAFTVECWWLANGSQSSYAGLVSQNFSSTTGGWALKVNNGSNVVEFSYINSTPQNIVASVNVNDGAWHHLAITRSGTSLYMYVDGVLQTTGTLPSGFSFGSGSGNTDIGYQARDGAHIKGYVSNLRMVNGGALSTGSTYPISTTPLTTTVSSGTVSLLTCQSNRFVDNSVNAYPITIAAGTPSVQRFSPFNPTTAYTTATIGGSGYFDGSGDYLTTPTAASLNLGASSTWTIEFWGYVGASFGTFCPISMVQDTNSRWDIEVSASSTTLLFNNTTATTFTNPSTIAPNSWFHMAFTRNGTTVKMYVNGVASATTSTSNLSSVSTATLTYIGRNNLAGYTFDWNGYISDLRLVNGTAVYTTNFTPPTAPLTAVSGTSLLTNFTNAGIYDSAMMNDLETVGNAQISTSVKKYGTGSIAFDGTDDCLVPQNNSLNSFGTGDFTIEAWVYPTSTSSASIVSNRAAGGADTVFTCAFTTANGLFLHTQNTAVLNSGTNVTANTWQHVAFVRSSGTLKIYLNGTSVGSASMSQNLSSTNAIYIAKDGTKNDGGQTGLFTGYIDDLRVTKGLARYTANFTAPTAALPNY
jgi:hypothetical protein